MNLPNELLVLLETLLHKYPYMSKPEEAKVLEFLTINVSEGSSDKDQKKCKELLIKMLDMRCNKSIITAADLKEIYTLYFKDTKVIGKTVIFQKTTLLVSTMFKLQTTRFDVSANCFNMYYSLIFGIFRVLANIKNQEGILNCCSDLKRHEINSLISSTVYLQVNHIINDKVFTEISENFFQLVSYHAEICNGLKCESKPQKTLNMYNILYKVLYSIFGQNAVISGNIRPINECIKILFALTKDVRDDSQLMTPDILALSIYKSSKDKESAVICANGIASLLAFDKTEFVKSSKESKKSKMSLMVLLREKTQMLGFQTATEFVQSNLFSDIKLAGKDFIPLAEFILIEMASIFRYGVSKKATNNEAVLSELFTKLSKETKNPQILAEACQMVSDFMLKFLDMETFKKVNQLLEEEAKREFNMKVSLALAFNNYSIFFGKNKSTAKDVKESMEQSIEHLRLEQELKQLKYLNESLRHFTDVISHLIQNKTDIDHILSSVRIKSILNNMAINYYVRDIKYKDIEAYSLLWHFVLIEGQTPISLFNAATFFLDHHEMLTDSSGNYIKISKKLKPLTINDVLHGANNALKEDFFPKFNELPPSSQSCILSYMLSLWTYYMIQGKVAEGFKRFKQFKDLWLNSEASEHKSGRITIQSKLYFSVAMIELKYHNQCADKFFSLACSTLLGMFREVKEIDQEFSFQFYQTFHRVILEAINFSMNRLTDMDHYDSAMVSLINSTAKKGYCMKTLNLLSLSILRFLNMEKASHAKNHLKLITQVLGLKEELLTESPMKPETAITTFCFDAPIESFRKTVVNPAIPIQSELSMIYEDNSSELSRQIKSFIHDASCRCEICKIPQLKFVMFQVGCHYSRLMWLMGKLDISLKFNNFALDSWRNVCDKIRRLKDCEFLAVNKINFSVFSIRWLFQIADTLINLGRLEEVEEVFTEIELICTSNIPDYDCFKHTLHCQKENLSFLMEDGSVEKVKTIVQLSFGDFLKSRPIKSKPEEKSKSPNCSIESSKKPAKQSTPTEPPKKISKMSATAESSKKSSTPPAPKATTKKQISPSLDDIIYVDSTDDEQLVPKTVPKTARKAAASSRVEQTPKPAKTTRSNKTDQTPSTTRKTKAAEVNDSTKAPTTARKTRRHLL